MAGSHVVALGAGTIIVLILWTIAGFLWLFLYRSQSSTRYMVLLIVSLITFVLVILPTETSKKDESTRPEDEDVHYDYMFLWKGFLICLLILGVIIGVILDISQYWTMVVHGSKPVPKRNGRIKQD